MIKIVEKVGTNKPVTIKEMKNTDQDILLMHCSTFLGTKIFAVFHKLCKISKRRHAGLLTLTPKAGKGVK